MMRKFKTPQYQDTFRYNWAFEKYGDKTNFWLEIDYFINRENFETRTSNRPLLDFNLRAENREKIFRNFSSTQIAILQAKGYKLLAENVIPSNADEDILKVTELYGYATSNSYTLTGSEVYSFLPIEENEKVQTLIENGTVGSTPTATYNVELDQITMTVSSAADFKIGQIVRIYGSATGDSLNAIGNETRIVSKTSTTITIEGCSMTFYKWNGGEMSTFQMEQLAYYLSYHKAYSGANTWNGSFYLQSLKKKTDARNLPVSAISTITYHESFPTVATADKRFKVLDYNNGESAIIDFSTTPNYMTYRQMISNGDYINISDPEISEIKVFNSGTGIFTKSVRKAKAQ